MAELIVPLVVFLCAIIGLMLSGIYYLYKVFRETRKSAQETETVFIMTVYRCIYKTLVIMDKGSAIWAVILTAVIVLWVLLLYIDF